MARKILWAHPFSLHDTSSGAAIEIRTMLEAFLERGIEARALCSPIFDDPMALQLLLQRLGIEKLPEENFNIAGDPLHTLYIPCKSIQINDYTQEEMNRFLGHYLKMLDEFRPDIVLMYCDSVLSFSMQVEAKLRGISVVCMVCNGNYASGRFPMADLILTESEATAQAYRRHGLNMMHTGAFMDPKRFKVKRVTPKYVTLINPVSAKGLSIATKLVMMAEKELPGQRFLFVESRGKFSEGAAMLHAPDSKETFPLRGHTFHNLDVCGHTTDMASIYAQTAVLLAPSLWWESFGMVAAEALINGIPVLSSQSGGLPGVVGNGGMSLPVSEACAKQEDWMRLPTDEEMRPWMDALKQMLSNMKEWKEKAKEEGKRHALDICVDRTLGYMEPLFAKAPGERPLFYLSGMFK